MNDVGVNYIFPLFITSNHIRKPRKISVFRIFLLLLLPPPKRQMANLQAFPPSYV